MRVGNGGFGPAYGVIGIEGGAVDDLGRTVEEIYKAFWRPRVPIVFGEAASVLLLRLRHIYLRSLLQRRCIFEPNIRGDGPGGRALDLQCGSLAEWFESWLCGDA
jgi:hypothetical protein